MLRGIAYMLVGLAAGVVLVGAFNGFTLLSAIVAPPGKPATNASGSSASANSTAPSPLAAKFGSHLMALGADGEPHGYDDSKLAPVKYWAFYYSASWCPPCRAFTPQLVNFYNDFKPTHPDFELIFVNDDQSDGDMVNYMKGDSMPWPAVWFADIDNPNLDAKKYCGPGIPCLVLVDSDGNVLSDSFANGQYTGPQHVMDDIRSMVP